MKKKFQTAKRTNRKPVLVHKSLKNKKTGEHFTQNKMLGDGLKFLQYSTGYLNISLMSSELKVLFTHTVNQPL